MIIHHKEQRVAVFIDAQNLYHTARHLYRKYVNFGAVLELVVGDRKLVRALAYVIATESGDEVAFFEALQKQGIETKIKDLQVFAGGAKKGDWDVGMAIDAIVMSPRLDTIVIISGDGDFVPLVQYLQMHSGVRVEVATFEASASASLVAAADHFLDLSEAPKKILMGRTARATSPKKNTKKVLKSETARKPKKGSGRKNSKADK